MLKTLFQQLLNISHALERLILMTLENLKTLGQSCWHSGGHVGYGWAMATSRLQVAMFRCTLWLSETSEAAS